METTHSICLMFLLFFQTFGDCWAAAGLKNAAQMWRLGSTLHSHGVSILIHRGGMSIMGNGMSI